MTSSTPLKFEIHKEEIKKAIDAKLALGLIPEKQGFILIDGFINIQLQNELGGGMVFGGPSIPAVAIVGKSTGLIYTFALKVLLPNISI